MPTYQYACKETACGHRFDAVQSFSDDTLTVCPVCEGQVRKVFSAVGVVFKGSGFYRNDSRETAKSANGSASKDSGAKDSGSKDSGSKDSGSKDSGSNGSSEKKTEAASSSSSSNGSSSGSSSTPSSTSSGSSSGSTSKAAAS